MAHHLSDLAQTPTNACRIPIFAPTRRPQAVSAWRVETPWGWAEITGRLGQQHRDLLDAARMVAEAEEWTSDGRLHLKVDPAKLRSALGGDATNQQRIKEWLEDLRVASVVVHVAGIDKTMRGGVVSDVVDSADLTRLHARPGGFNSDRRFWRISFGLGWSKLIEDDRSTKYPLRRVVELKHGFSQAVARFCLSHRQGSDTVAGLMRKLDASGLLRHRRADLIDDREGLSGLGIEVNEDAVVSGERRQSPVRRRQSPVSVGKVR